MRQTLKSYKLTLNPSASVNVCCFQFIMGHYAFGLVTSGAIFCLR